MRIDCPLSCCSVDQNRYVPNLALNPASDSLVFCKLIGLWEQWLLSRCVIKKLNALGESVKTYRPSRRSRIPILVSQAMIVLNRLFTMAGVVDTVTVSMNLRKSALDTPCGRLVSKNGITRWINLDPSTAAARNWPLRFSADCRNSCPV